MAAAEPGSLARSLATGLLDDASMFPPARAPMEAALGLHALAARGPWGFAQGRFLLPLGALDALARERSLLGDASALDVGVIVGSPADPGARAPLDDVDAAAARLRAADDQVTIALLEHRPADPLAVALPAAAERTVAVARRLGDDVAAFVEVVAVETVPSRVRDRVAAVASVGGAAVKVRCGGVEAGMVPDDEQLAVLVHTCVTEGVAFKGTAGLHHALAVAGGAGRRHGFVGVLVATLVAEAGGDVADVVRALTVTADRVGVDGDVLVADGERFDAAAVAAARRRFVAFGTCSFTEPLAELLALLGHA